MSALNLWQVLGLLSAVSSLFPTETALAQPIPVVSYVTLAVNSMPRQTLPAAREERIALADKLAAKVEKERLSDEEYGQLALLDDLGYDSLFSRAKAIQSDVTRAREGDKAIGQFNPFARLCEALTLVMKPAHTADIVMLYRMAEKNKSDSSRSALLTLMGTKSDQSVTLPIVLQVLKTEKDEIGYRYSPPVVAREVMAASTHPIAINYLIGCLDDPKIDDEIKHEAYCNLARVGGDAGVKAVLAHRSKPVPLKSLAEYMALDKLGTTPDARARVMAPLLAVHKDDRGVLWGLVRCGAIGSAWDLWIVRHDGKHWVDPVFTGVDLSTRRFRYKNGAKAPDKFAGMSEEDLLKSGWFGKFVGNKDLMKGTAGGGWTDLEAKRLGLTAQKPQDAAVRVSAPRSANLLTDRKPQTETEKVLAAAFEGKFRYAEDVVPCVVYMPAGVQPIEFLGWGWIVLAVKEGSDVPLSEYYGEGMASIRFDSSEYGIEDPDPASVKSKSVIFNRDHTEAAVSISTYYDGLDGTVYAVHLKKFGDEWLVTACVMTAIS